MIYKGSCKCKRWRVQVELDSPLENVNPRVCDCDYCQANPSRIISDPSMSIVFSGDGVSVKQNGDRLANFYHCSGCNVLLSVGCRINGQLRGVVNADLLQDVDQFGEPVQIQPRLLNADEKLERWNKLWGVLSGL